MSLVLIKGVVASLCIYAIVLGLGVAGINAWQLLTAGYSSGAVAGVVVGVLAALLAGAALAAM